MLYRDLKMRRVVPILAVLMVAGVGFLLMKRQQAQQDSGLRELDQRLGPLRVQWRAKQDKMMRAELSPLSRVDYQHLQPGDHRLGTDPTAAIRVQKEALAGYGGEVHLLVTPGSISLRASPAVQVNGAPAEERALRQQDLVAVGQVRLMVVGPPVDPQVAVYDLGAPARTAYHALKYYPDDSRYTVMARLERHGRPVQLQVDVSSGPPRVMDAVGLLRFEIGGAAYSLEAFLSSDRHDGRTDDLFIIFKDKTNGQPGGSYGAGRFLYAKVLPGDQVLLDFNQAWNPYCAYSVYFHCPLPPRSNWLPIELPVGEQDPGLH